MSDTERLLSLSDDVGSCLGDISREIKRSKLPYHENLRDFIREAYDILQKINEEAVKD